MSFCGDWGCFIHIPKTGGQWMRRLLSSTYGRGGTAGTATHGLPLKTKHPNERWFTVIRNPAYWMRSYWGHRSWEDHVLSQGKPYTLRRNDSLVWNNLVALTLRYMNEDFNTFAQDVCIHLPGLTDWFFGYFMAPGVDIVFLEKVNEWLTENYPETHPENHPKRNLTRERIGKSLPDITDSTYSNIWDSNPIISKWYKMEFGDDYKEATR